MSSVLERSPAERDASTGGEIGQPKYAKIAGRLYFGRQVHFNAKKQHDEPYLCYSISIPMPEAPTDRATPSAWVLISITTPWSLRMYNAPMPLPTVMPPLASL